MLLSDAIAGFLMFTRAEGFSEGTVKLYRFNLDILLRKLGDREMNKITETDLRGFFVYLREVYHKEKGHPDKPLAGATLRNFWKAIRSLFEWSKEEHLVKERPDISIKMPGNNPKIIMPLEEHEVKALLSNAEMSREVDGQGKRTNYRFKRHTGARDVALLILLLDTGIRAGEASRLNIADVDLAEGQIYIRPFGNSGIKTKSRVIPVGKATSRALWKYKTTLEDQEPNDPFFVTMTGRRMNQGAMLMLVRSLGDKAGVKNCHPHRLRHTFAIQYLRNGGDIFTLKNILGHNSLDMVEHYLQLAQSDTTSAHRKASPADRWHL